MGLVCNRHSIRYQLLLTRHKSLKTRGHTKSQLVYEGRLVLAVDLDFDACFVRCFICGGTAWQDVREDKEIVIFQNISLFTYNSSEI